MTRASDGLLVRALMLGMALDSQASEPQTLREADACGDCGGEQGQHAQGCERPTPNGGQE